MEKRENDIPSRTQTMYLTLFGPFFVVTGHTNPPHTFKAPKYNINHKLVYKNEANKEKDVPRAQTLQYFVKTHTRA